MITSKDTLGDSIEVFVGSTNPEKVEAAKQAMQAFFKQQTIVVATPLKVDHGITDWKSKHAIGQPFGLRQTAYGACNRMMNCWTEAVQKESASESPSKRLYSVGFENGLVQGEEVGQTHSRPHAWYDICYTALQAMDTNGSIIIKRGGFVQTEFDAAALASKESFDAAVLQYEQTIMPKIHRGQDLYLEWTQNHPGGVQTRGNFLQNNLVAALEELSKVENAKRIVDVCAKKGVVASSGPRYQNMLWMRDLAYMAPAYLMYGHGDALLQALKNICQAQCKEHAAYSNGYETFNRFGSIPIVTVTKDNERNFLLQRLRGSPEDPYWQLQLWNFCKENAPDALQHFPASKDEPSSLEHFSVEELKAYYHELRMFQENLKKTYLKAGLTPPGPSFALRRFMEGKLEEITPGTRDSEIHFIRGIFSLAEHAGYSIIDAFAESVANALFYLSMNVLDAADGLPRGADSRDSFADLLYDAKTLTNAVFWYQALEKLCQHCPHLEKTAFHASIERAVNAHLVKCPEMDRQISPFLLRIIKSPNDLSKVLSDELTTLRTTIQGKLLFRTGGFQPRDFIPGPRAACGLDAPVNDSPILSIIKTHFPTFVDGEHADPQSLAYAVLAQLIPSEHYQDVENIFKTADTPIGISVFVPISGKTAEESAILQELRGWVNWPHVSWTCVQALLAMDTASALNMAEEEREKLMQLPGCSEWYGQDLATGGVINGGDPEQGWAASSMAMAIDAFRRYYSQS